MLVRVGSWRAVPAWHLPAPSRHQQALANTRQPRSSHVAATTSRLFRSPAQGPRCHATALDL